MTDQITVHHLGPDDHDAVQMAVSWSNPPNIPDLATAMAHPKIVSYHQGWGRPSDIGVKAMDGEVVVGSAFARLSTDEDHGHGYLDDETPELGIGVAKGHRGQGIGRKLMDALAELARTEGFARLSLSVTRPSLGE